MRTVIHVFMPSFVEIPKAEVAKPGSFFPHSPSLCQVSSKSAQFSERYTHKCLLRSLQYRREACRLLLADKSHTFKFNTVYIYIFISPNIGRESTQ